MLLWSGVGYGRLGVGHDMAMNNVHVSEELLAELRSKAREKGKSVDDLAEEALRRGLEQEAWQDLLRYGSERGQASGYSEEDVPRLVKEWRREQYR